MTSSIKALKPTPMDKAKQHADKAAELLESIEVLAERDEEALSVYERRSLNGQARWWAELAAVYAQTSIAYSNIAKS